MVIKKIVMIINFGDFDEDDFNIEFVCCVLCVMFVKKLEGVGEKMVRFIGLFLWYVIDKDNEIMGEVDMDISIMFEMFVMRFMMYLMVMILLLL